MNCARCSFFVVMSHLALSILDIELGKDFLMARKRFALTFLGLVLIVILAACGNGNFQNNALGYTFVGSNFSTDQHRTITIPSSNAQSVDHLRNYGIGLPPEAFTTQYGQPLSPSQPPTQLWYKATLDDFPGGSVMIVGF